MVATAAEQELKLSIKHELIRRGIFCEWLLHPEQKEVYHLTVELREQGETDPIVGAWSRKGGKTFTSMAIAFEFCNKIPNFQVFAFAPKKDQINRFLTPIAKELTALFPKDKQPTRKYSKWEFPNGSVIELLGADYQDGDTARGAFADMIIIDEAGFLTVSLEYLYKSIVLPMIQHTNGQVIILSTMPKSRDHEYIKYLEAAIEEKRGFKKNIYQLTQYNTNPKKIERIIKACGGKDSHAFRREYMCEAITDPEFQIIPEFDINLHAKTIDDLPTRPTHYQSYTVIDFGFKHYTGVIFGYYNFEEGMVIAERELLMRGKSTKELADAIKKNEEELWGDHIRATGVKPYRIGDNNSQLCHDLSKDHNLTVMAVKKKSLQAMVGALRANINTRYNISPDCVKLRNQLENGIWNDDRTKFEETGDGGHSDLIAALIYLNLSVKWHKNPFPATYLNPLHFLTKNGNKRGGDNHDAKVLFKPRRFK